MQETRFLFDKIKDFMSNFYVTLNHYTHLSPLEFIVPILKDVSEKHSLRKIQ